MSSKERESVDVAFAIEEEGGVVAVIPGSAGTVNRPDTCTCYAHMGQHSSGRIDYFTDQCVAASLKEYANLLKELGSIGYDVTVIPFGDIENAEYLAARIKELEE